VHFFKTVEIEDFGEPSIITFYKNGFDTIDKILNMKQFDIVNIEGFGVKSSMNLLSQFGKLKTEGIPLAKLLHALDVFDGMIGEKTCQKIFDESSDYLDYESIMKVEGIADKTAKKFLDGLDSFIKIKNIGAKFSLKETILEMFKISYIKTPKPKVIGNKLKDERICFTGCRPSKEQLESISLQGGTVVSGVSKKTTMLVVKNMTDKVLSSSKACKAKELGIKIVELRKLEA
jgi:NAD-dependent DNA ligase